jgi:hypothetical protein
MEAKRRLGPMAITGIAIVVLAAALFWAASSLASGGAASNENGARDSPTATTVQAESDAQGRDCPNSDGESESSAGV